MKINDLKIGVRLAILAGVLMLGILMISFQAWRTLRDTNRAAMDNLRHAVLMSDAVDEARHAQVLFKTQVQEWKNILLRGSNQGNFDKYKKAFIAEGEAVQGSLNKLKTILAKANVDNLDVESTQHALAELQRKYLDALKQYDVAKKESAETVDAHVKGMDRAPTEKLDGIVAYVLEQEQKEAHLAFTNSEARYAAANAWMLAMCGMIIGLGTVIAIWLARSITQPIVHAVRIAESVASGNLSTYIEVSSRDETGQLMAALKNMNDSLAKIVAAVRNGTESIASASAQIASGNLDLSSRTETQASALEETASSMEQLTSAVQQNSEHARHANELAVAASESAEKGGVVVAQVVQTMGEIHASSNKVVDIIGVIDSISFQTNILALNAAVEAARAGEQGRGFAIVAAEVRTLAQRSAAAAKEIKQLINDSAERTSVGAKLVDRAGQTMHEIVASIRSVTAIMSEISAASQEQHMGIGQINAAVSQMDEGTQQNAALVEEAAAAAQSLQQQADHLLGLVSVFKLDNTQQEHPARSLTSTSAVKPAVVSMTKLALR